MIDLTPEQEAAAHAALEAKEARTKAQVIKVKPGAIERNSMTETAQVACLPTAEETIPVKTDAETTVKTTKVGFFRRLKQFLST